MPWLAWDSVCQPSAQPPSGPPPLPSAQRPAWLKVSLWCGRHTPQRLLPTGLAILQDCPLCHSCSRLFFFFLLLGQSVETGTGSRFPGVHRYWVETGGGDLPATLSQGRLHILDSAPSFFFLSSKVKVGSLCKCPADTFRDFGDSNKYPLDKSTRA